MNRVSGFCCVALSALVLAACGGGGGGGGVGGSGGGGGPGTGSPTLDDAARRAVLSDLGTLLILPGLETLSDQATDLSSAVAALASAPGNATARSAAQDAWSSAMVAVQRAEILQVGPAARSSEPGGMDLRDQIYAYPQINLCAIHTAAYSDSQVTASSPINTTGMGALEYLLFSDADNANCLPGAGIDAQTKRAEHASRIADRIAQVLAEWEASGDNFINEFANAGNGGSTFSTPQMALNAVSTAIFYAEKETKDRKIANPTGVGATGLPACPTVSCPQRVESLYAQTSGAHIVANLQVFRDVFTGVSGGLGLNDLLDGIGREDLSAQIVTQLNAAINAAVALEDSFEAEVAAIPSEQACANAVSSRSGDPAACALLGLVDAATDTLRAEVTSALNLTIPNSAAGDND